MVDIHKENTRRRVYGVETPHSNHEEGTPYTKKYFDSLKKIVANPDVQIQIIKSEGGNVPIREITDIRSYKNANGELCYDWTERIIL